MLKKDVLAQLKALDEEASLLLDSSERIRLVIAGGSALILMEYISRSTHDIDILEVSRKIESLLSQYDMNTRVQTYINNFPYNFEDRIVPVDIHGRIIDFYTASLEDIVIAKLCSYRDTDRQDIIAPNVLRNLDWKMLERLALDDIEVRNNMLNERAYLDFLSNFREYERRYRP